MNDVNKEFKPHEANIDELIASAYRLRNEFLDAFGAGVMPEAWLIGPPEYLALIKHSMNALTLSITTEFNMGRLSKFMGIPVKTKLTPGLDLEIQDSAAMRLAYPRKKVSR